MRELILKKEEARNVYIVLSSGLEMKGSTHDKLLKISPLLEQMEEQGTDEKDGIIFNDDTKLRIKESQYEMLKQYMTRFPGWSGVRESRKLVLGLFKKIDDSPLIKEEKEDAKN